MAAYDNMVEQLTTSSQLLTKLNPWLTAHKRQLLALAAIDGAWYRIGLSGPALTSQAEEDALCASLQAAGLDVEAVQTSCEPITLNLGV